MNTPRLRAVILLLLLFTPVPALAVTDTWDGGGADNNFTTSNNWLDNTVPVVGLVNTDLVFAGTTRTFVNFDTSFAANSVTFDPTAGAFNLFGGGGQILTIGAGGIVNNDADLQTLFNLAVNIGTDQSTFNAANGPLNFTGPIALGPNILIVSGSANTTLQGQITGIGSINKTGSGTLLLPGNTTLEIDLFVNAGTVALNSSGTTTIGPMSTFSISGGTFNADGNLTINGGVLNSPAGGFNLAADKVLTIQAGGQALYPVRSLIGPRTINVTGVNSQLYVATEFILGAGARINLTENAALRTQGDVFINGGLLTQDASSFFGLDSRSTLTINGGGQLISAASFFGIVDGDIIINGANSKLTANGVDLGDNSVMKVNSGGSVTSANAFSVGQSGSATLLVDGSGSSASGGLSPSIWGGGGGDPGDTAHITFSNNASGNFPGGVDIAAESIAHVNVESGADLEVGSLSISRYGFVPVQGTLTVAEPGSTVFLTPGSMLTIGHASVGTGTLNVNDGASFSVGAGGTTTLNATGTININGGGVALQTLVNNGGRINFNAGLLNLLGDLHIGAGGVFGGDLVLTNNRRLFVSGTTRVENVHTLTLDGGMLRTSALSVVDGTFEFNRGTLEVFGPSGLTIGQGGSLGGNVSLRDGQTLNVISGTTINADGLLVVESGGRITSGFLQNNGELVLDGLAATAVAETIGNAGLIRGNGQIVASSAISNAAAGEIRAEAGKRIKFQGAFATNAGKLNLQGGTAEFPDSLLNFPMGQILGRGTLIVGILQNDGHIAFSSGITDVFGDVYNQTNNFNAGITVSGNADVTFWDDVNNVAGSLFRVSAGSSATFFGGFSGAGISGTGDVFFEADISPGASPALVEFGGNVSFGNGSALEIELGGLTAGSQFDELHVAGLLSLGGALEVSFIDGFTPALGNAFDILDWGSLSGTFDTIALPTLTGSLAWDISQLYTSGVLLIAALGTEGDYNQNGIVDAADYIVWRKNNGSPNGYNTWRANFGRTAASGATAGLTSASSVEPSSSAPVPEPTSLLLMLGALIPGLSFRMRAVG